MLLGRLLPGSRASAGPCCIRATGGRADPESAGGAGGKREQGGERERDGTYRSQQGGGRPPSTLAHTGDFPSPRAGTLGYLCSTAGVICYTPKDTPCATSGSDSCSFYLAARATRRSRHSLTDGRLPAASRSTPVVMEARSHPSPPLAEATHQVVPVPPEAVALADRFELILGVGRRDGCGGHATDHARRRACAEDCRPGPRQRLDDSAPRCGMVHPGTAPRDVACPSVREVTMRYAWIALLLLFAGCAGYLPPAASNPAPSTFD